MKRKITSLFMALSLLMACATAQNVMEGLPYETGNLYFYYKGQYEAKIADPAIPEEQKEAFSATVVPVLQKLKVADKAALRAQILYRETGTKPIDYDQLQAELNTIVAEIASLFAKGVQ